MADTESRPLLRDTSRSPSPERSTTPAHGQPTSSQTIPGAWRAVIVPLLVAAFLHEVGTNITEVTSSELGEEILCRNRFRDHGGRAGTLALGDPRCKGAEVQADLSMLQAVEHTFGSIPSILTSVLYGVASDRFGRKSILCLGIVGLLVLYAVDFTIYRFPSVFNIYLIWPATFLVFIGGGPPVSNSMTFAMISDVVSEAERANVFFYLIATGLVGNLVGAPLTFYLMEYGPWVATAVGYSCYVARLLVVLFLCHDMKRDAALLYHDDEPQPAVEDSDKSAVAAAFSTMLNPVLAIKQTWSAAVQVFWMHKKIGILMLTLLFSDLGGYANILFNQYIAKRFDWSWSQGPFFSSTHTCVSVYTYECRRARQSINPMTAVVVGSASVYGAASFTTSWTPSPTLYSRAENIATELPGCAVRCLRQQCASFDNACLCVVETKSIIDRCVLGVCGMPEAIFTRNLTETTCQTPVRRKTSDFNPLVLGITPITVLIVFFRLVYNQFFSPRTRFNLEELALIAASGVGIVTLALQIFGVNGHGMGTDVWGLDRSTLYTFRRYFYMIQIGYIVLMLFLKLTVTFFYFNIFFGQRIRTVLWATVIFHVAALTACALAILIQCLPIEYQWDKFYHIHDDSMTGQCININTACWINSSISVASDLWLLAVPLSQLRKLKLHWKKKLGASLMFIAGFSVTVISVLRLSSIGTYASTTNPTWDQWDILWWSFIEIHVGLVCTCLPAMRLILIRLAPQIFDSKSSKIHTISLNRVSSLGTQLTHLTQFTQLGGDEEAALPKPSPAPAATLLSTAATAPEPILYNHYNSSSNAGESLAAVESPERWHDEVPLRKAKKPDNWRNSVP